MRSKPHRGRVAASFRMLQPRRVHLSEDDKLGTCRALEVVSIVFIVVMHLMQEGNRVGNRGAELIGDGLKVNNSLHYLRLVRLFCFAGSCEGRRWEVGLLT